VDRNSVEHAAMLGTQGEYDDAIALLERHLLASRRDIAACRLLAEMYFQKGEKQLPGDRETAIGLLRKSIRLDPTHARASARLKMLEGGRAIARAPAAAPSSSSCDIAG
jgi:tetratricopeptide (TPR) repeat protein